MKNDQRTHYGGFGLDNFDLSAFRMYVILCSFVSKTKMIKFTDFLVKANGNFNPLSSASSSFYSRKFRFFHIKSSLYFSRNLWRNIKNARNKIAQNPSISFRLSIHSAVKRLENHKIFTEFRLTNSRKECHSFLETEGSFMWLGNHLCVEKSFISSN